MTRKAANSSPTPQGGIALHIGMADLYETRHGMFGNPRILWDEGEPPAPAPAPVPSPDDGQLSRSLQNLINRTGGTDRTAELLFNENRDYRARIRELEGQLPAQGAVVLTPEQAAQWQAYQALDADPAALQTRLEQGDQATQREQGRTLAEASGANADVLQDRLRAAGLRAEVREVPGQNGAAPSRTVHVLNTQGQDQGELRAYAQQHWAAYVPSLFPAAQGTGQGAGGTVITGQAGAGTGTTVPVTNPIAAALQGQRPAAQATIRAFDLTPQGGNT